MTAMNAPGIMTEMQRISEATDAHRLSEAIDRSRAARCEPGGSSPRAFAESMVKALPTKVRIGPHDYQIEIWRHAQIVSNDRLGECSHIEATIRVADSFPTAGRAAETFIHECLHGMYYTMDMRDNDDQERVVSSLGKGIIGLFRDNPWLARWIGEATK